MLKIYSTGCIRCLEIVKILLKNKVKFIVEDSPSIVEDIATKTIGVVPIFEFDEKFYNSIQIKTMISNGVNFQDVIKITEPKIIEVEKITEEPKIFNKKIKQEE